MMALATAWGVACHSSHELQADADARDDGGMGAGGDQVTFLRESEPCGRWSAAVPNQILDTGYVGIVDVFRFEGNRVFTGGRDRWLLWSLSEKMQLAGGKAPHSDANGNLAFSDMRAGLLVVEPAFGTFELRSADDGHVSATLQIPDVVTQGLAPDGSYFWALTPLSLTIWSANGEVLATRMGSDLTGQVAALAGHLYRVEGGTAPQRIEAIDVATGRATLSAPLPSGTFGGWFLDGAHFFAGDRNATSIYRTADNVLVATGAASSVDGGYGDYVWWFDLNEHSLHIRSVSKHLASVGTFTANQVAYLGRGRLATFVDASADPLNSKAGAMAVLDLNQVQLSPQTLKHEDDLSHLSANPAFSDDGQYAYLGQSGVIWTGGGVHLGCGGIGAMAGADDGTVTVATSIGILVFRLGDQGVEIQGRFTLTGEVLEMSGDGLLLAVRRHWLNGAQMVSVVSLESHALLHTWGRADAFGLGGPALPDPDFVVDFSLARYADRIATSFVTQASYSEPWVRHVYLSDARGDNVQEVPGARLNLRLSPDGTRLLVQAGQPGSSASIYEGATLLATAIGAPSSWWDDTHYVTRVTSNPTLYDLAGVESTGITIPMRVDDLAVGVNYGHTPLVQLAGGRLYSAAANAILDQSTGAVVMSGSGVWLAAAAGPFAIKSMDGARLSIERY